ncbi:MAG: hypothetical protein ACRDF4_00545 [Rhabdochlamydiaceae bacterium]
MGSKTVTQIDDAIIKFLEVMITLKRELASLRSTDMLDLFLDFITG